MKTRFIDAKLYHNWNQIVPVKGIYKWVLMDDELVIANVRLHVMVVLLAICRTKQQFIAETDGVTNLQDLCARHRSRIRAAGSVRCDGWPAGWKSEGFSLETPEALETDIRDALMAAMAKRSVDRMEVLEVHVRENLGSENAIFNGKISRIAPYLEQWRVSVQQIKEGLRWHCVLHQPLTVGDLLCAIREVVHTQ